MMRLYHSIFLVLFLKFIGGTTPPAWKTTDRYFGFRFEIFGEDLLPLIPTIVRAADERACFGWVQESLKNKTLVGEVRCNKIRGEDMKKYLESQLQMESKLSSIGVGKNLTIHQIRTKVYPDTRILLHFSHFKVVDNRRHTCFRDEPHMCEENDFMNRMW